MQCPYVERYAFIIHHGTCNAPMLRGMLSSFIREHAMPYVELYAFIIHHGTCNAPMLRGMLSSFIMEHALPLC
jgi:hypothetical protein